MTVCLIVALIEWGTDWLIDLICLIWWLDWLIGWLVGWLIDWLIDWIWIRFVFFDLTYVCALVWFDFDLLDSLIDCVYEDWWFVSSTTLMMDETKLRLSQNPTIIPWLKTSFFHLNLSGNGVQFHNNLLHLSMFWLVQSIHSIPENPISQDELGLGIYNMDIRIYIYIWIYQICRSNLHIVGYTSIISILGYLNLPYLHYGELPIFWRLNKFNLLFLADIKDDWFLSLWSLLESPFFATCAGWARPPKPQKPDCTGCATSRCQRTAERLFGCGAAAVAGGNIHPLEGGWAEKMMGISAIFHQGHVQFKWFTQEGCNFKWFLTKNNCDLGDFTEYGDFTKLQGIGNHGNKILFSLLHHPIVGSK